MKNLWPTLVCGMLLAGPAAAEPVAHPLPSPSERAWSLFEAGRYAEGLAALQEVMVGPSYPAEERARAQLTLARFYDDYADSTGDAIQFYRTIGRRFELPHDHPLVQEAEQKQAELQAREDRFREENELLSRARWVGKPDDRARFEQQVADLTALLKNRPDYPHRAAACFYLGEAHFFLGHYRAACRYMEEALQLRPALDFSIPVSSRLAQARYARRRQLLTHSAWGVLGVFWIAAAGLFFFGRPWRWLGCRHLVSLVLFEVVWGVCFGGCVWWTQQGRSVQVPEHLCDSPAYVMMGFVEPLTEILRLLFGYGAFGVFASWVLAVGTARFRPRWTWAFVNASASLLLFVALLGVFYLRYGSTPFIPDTARRWSYLAGAFAYPLTRNQAPFFLTDPKAYAGFQKNLDAMSEPDLREWFGRYAEPEATPSATQLMPSHPEKP